MNYFTLFLFVLLSAWSAEAAVDGMVSKNQYWGKVIKVYDGDSLTAKISLWPGQIVEAKVRILGIDAPEVRGKCRLEKEKAIVARNYLRKQVLGTVIRITNVSVEKYGRILAAVWHEDGTALAGKMTRSGYARAYDGGQRRGWCP